MCAVMGHGKWMKTGAMPNVVTGYKETMDCKLSSKFLSPVNGNDGNQCDDEWR